MVEETSTAELEFLQRKCASMTPKLYCQSASRMGPAARHRRSLSDARQAQSRG